MPLMAYGIHIYWIFYWRISPNNWYWVGTWLEMHVLNGFIGWNWAKLNEIPTNVAMKDDYTMKLSNSTKLQSHFKCTPFKWYAFGGREKKVIPMLGRTCDFVLNDRLCTQCTHIQPSSRQSNMQYLVRATLRNTIVN